MLTPMADTFSAESRLIHAGIPGPFEAWLALRIARQSDSALAIARHLAGHPRVAAVHYPGIDTSTSEVARRQMPDGFGPLLSFEVLPGTAEAADTVVASSRLIRRRPASAAWSRPGNAAPGGRAKPRRPPLSGCRSASSPPPT